MAQMLGKLVSVGGARSKEHVNLQDTATGPTQALGHSRPDQGKVWISGP